MQMGVKKSIKRVIIERIIGLVVFIIIVAAINYFSFDNEYYEIFVKFINVNLILMIMIHIIMSLGEIMGVAIFPVNMIAPPINAGGAMLILTLIFKAFELFDSVVEFTLFTRARPFYTLIYIALFLVVIVVNYAIILSRESPKKSAYDALHDFFEWLRIKLQ